MYLLICKKIREIYPDIGVCGIDLDAVHNVEMVIDIHAVELARKKIIQAYNILANLNAHDRSRLLLSHDATHHFKINECKY